MDIRVNPETNAERELRETRLVLQSWAEMQRLDTKKLWHAADLARALEKVYMTPRPYFTTGNEDHVSFEPWTKKGYVFLYPKDQRSGLCLTTVKSVADFCAKFRNAEQGTKETVLFAFSVCCDLTIDVIHLPEQLSHD